MDINDSWLAGFNGSYKFTKTWQEMKDCVNDIFAFLDSYHESKMADCLSISWGSCTLSNYLNTKPDSDHEGPQFPSKKAT